MTISSITTRPASVESAKPSREDFEINGVTALARDGDEVERALEAAHALTCLLDAAFRDADDLMRLGKESGVDSLRGGIKAAVMRAIGTLVAEAAYQAERAK